MRVTRNRMLAATAALTLFVAGCNTSAPSGSPDSAESVHLYGSDGNMSNNLGMNLADRPGVLAGMKGTAPLAPLSDDFKARLRDVQPDLVDFNYSGQSYDAVAVAALAAEIARSTNGRDIARYLPGVTTGGRECATIADCLAAIRAGTDIQYRGPSLRLGGFTDKGEPATATYGTLHFSRDNKIDEGKTEYVGAGNEGNTTQAPQPAPPSLKQAPKEVPLVIGGLLPKTGQLASMYPPMVAGAKLAVIEVNDAGGVLGEPVVWLDGDDGTNPSVAKQTATKLLASKVHVIIGAGASGVSKEVLPQITGAGVLMISPSATADELSSVPDNGLFFRTAAPDLLQAKALADIVMRDGVRRVFIVARDDAWGLGLMRALRTDLEAAGVPLDGIKVFNYQPGANADDKPNVAGLPEQVKEFQPAGVVVLGFDESSVIIDALAAGGIPLRN